MVRSSKPRTSSPPAPTWLLAEITYIRSTVFLPKSSPNICKKCEGRGEGKAQQSCCLCVCVSLCVCMCVHAHALSRVQPFATPWIIVHQAPLSMGILQARILECIAISYSRGSSQPRDRNQVFCISCIGRPNAFTFGQTRD
ncbi:unnamed protein product [Rangifer tarandus platyrhynchus]|uniref:Uncharacterized protein n=1 Tax=Rangifer tarandus platyrhynchus TaxID=3082113 RepID=A0AC59YW10_RANTA